MREQRAGRAECRCGTFSSGGCRHVVWYEASHLSHISMLGACSSRAVQHIWVAHNNQPHSELLKIIPELVARHTHTGGRQLVACLAQFVVHLVHRYRRHQPLVHCPVERSCREPSTQWYTIEMCDYAARTGQPICDLQHHRIRLVHLMCIAPHQRDIGHKSLQRSFISAYK